MLAHRFSGPVALHVWLDASTSMLRRLRAEGQFSYLSAPTQLQVTVDLTDINAVNRIAEPPANAKPASKLFQ